MMYEPKEGDEAAVKRVIRYLLHQPELGLLYKWGAQDSRKDNRAQVSWADLTEQ